MHEMDFVLFSIGESSSTVQVFYSYGAIRTGEVLTRLYAVEYSMNFKESEETSRVNTGPNQPWNFVQPEEI